MRSKRTRMNRCAENHFKHQLNAFTMKYYPLFYLDASSPNLEQTERRFSCNSNVLTKL